MAEAVVDGTPVSRFFCHKCDVEFVERLLPNYTCPHCTSGFIEQVEESGGGGSGADDGSQGDGRSDLHGFNMDIGGEDFADMDLDLGQRPDDDFIRMYLDFPQEYRETVEGGRAGGNDSQRGRGTRLRAMPGYRERMERIDNILDDRLDRILDRRMRRRRPHRQLQQVNHLIENFILNLSGFGLHLPAAEGGHQPVLFLGNPGDYVWGRDGLDTIVTQLLNQMDGSGPPPLPRKQIDEIPTASVSQSQIDIKLQCSICWEDFILAELVRQLPCKHIYHTPCIEPWLELHGTCPICRQSLGDQTSADANRDTVGPSLAALFRAANQSTNSRTPSASSSSTSTSDE